MDKIPIYSTFDLRRRLVEVGLTYQKPEREYYEADDSLAQVFGEETLSEKQGNLDHSGQRQQQ